MQVAPRSQCASSALRSFSALCLPASASLLGFQSQRGAATAAQSASRRRELRMRVILKQTSDLGAAHSVISVRRGYARHTLLRKGLADYATNENLFYAAQSAAAEKEAERRRKDEAQRQAKGGRADAAAAESQGSDRAAASASVSASVASASSSSGASSALHTEDDSVHQAAILRRLRSQAPLILTRAVAGGLSGSKLVQPIQLKEVYAKLAPEHPTLSIKQLSFSKYGSSQELSEISSFGTHQLRVQLPFERQPALVWVNVRKAGQFESGRAAEVAAEKAAMKAAKLASAEKAAGTAL
jgi:hypothetical protein